MKEQTYIAKLENEELEMIDFERWGYKRSATCLKYMKSLMQHPAYRRAVESAAYIALYKTEPDGSNQTLVYRETVNNFLG